MHRKPAKIIYLANARLPTEKAHGIQIVKMCEALANRGAVIGLVVPNRLNSIKDDVFDYYGIKKNFVFKKLPCIDLISIASWLGPIAYWVEAISFAWSVKKYLKHFSGMVYTRELSNIAFLGSNLQMVYETHNLPTKPHLLFRCWLRKFKNLVVITESIKDDLVALGFPVEQILVAPDAVDFKMFDIKSSKVDCRRRLNLPLDKKIVLYSGHLYDWKGADILLNAAKFLHEHLLVFVGGTDADIIKFKNKMLKAGIQNAIVVGHHPVSEIPIYLGAADVLILPNSAKQTISAHYTSPLKLFEYMASQRPIVASDLPSLREILDEQSAVFFEPDNPQSLTRSIKFVFDNPAVAAQKVGLAHLRVQNFTWEKRAENILKFIQ